MPVWFAIVRDPSWTRGGRATTRSAPAGRRPRTARRRLRWLRDRRGFDFDLDRDQHEVTTVTLPGAGFFVLSFITIGLKEILLIAGVALALYGRSGSRLLKSTRYGRTIDPWLNLVRVPSGTRRNARSATALDPAPPVSRRPGRVFWALSLAAAAAVAAWVATRIVILNGAAH